MYMRSPHPCGKVLDNLCIKVYFCGKVCVLDVLQGDTYDDLNVSQSSDLSEQSITNAQKCQEGGDKFYQGLTVQKYQCFL